MRNIGPWELVAVVAVIVLLFGWKKLPDMARSVGRSMRVFKSEMGEMKNDKTSSTVPGEVIPPASPQTPPPAAVPAPQPTSPTEHKDATAPDQRRDPLA